MCVILHPFRHQAPTGQTGKKNDTNDHETNSTRHLGSQASNASRATCQRKVQSMGRRMRRIWINENGGETVCSQKPPTRSRSRRAGTARDLCNRSCRPRPLIARPTRLPRRGRSALCRMFRHTRPTRSDRKKCPDLQTHTQTQLKVHQCRLLGKVVLQCQLLGIPPKQKPNALRQSSLPREAPIKAVSLMECLAVVRWDTTKKLTA